MKKYLGIVAAMVAFAFPAVSQAATSVTTLSGFWSASNSSLRLTPDGVNFGIYPTANSGGSLYYSGMNGKTLADVKQLSYTFRYTARNEPGNYTAAPYLRIFLNGDTQDVVLDPSMCATSPTPQNERVSLEMTTSEIRYSDDGCDSNASRQSWADVVTAHGTDIISGIYVTQGFSVGEAFSADLFKLGVNNESFVFGAPVAGPAGQPGVDGKPGVSGVDGKPGPAGATIITQIISTPAPVVKGASIRTLHAPNRKGQKIVKVRAWLLVADGKEKLTTRGKTVIVDLRGKNPANYNVIIETTYRRANGKTYKVRSSRNLSVTLSK